MRFGLRHHQTKFLTEEQIQEEKKESAEEETVVIPKPPVSLPLEWQPFAQHIEAARSIQPTKEYLGDFAHRLQSRIVEEQLRERIIEDYLHATAWRRWSMRGLAAAAMFALVVTCEVQREELDLLRNRVQTLEQQMSTALPIQKTLFDQRDRENVMLQSMPS